jgi:hypothetical protein
MSKHFAVDKDDLQELAKMVRAVWLVIEAEPDANRAMTLTDIFGMFGEILADVERAPITIVTPAEPRH